MKTDIGTRSRGMLLQIPEKYASGFGIRQWAATRIFRNVVEECLYYL